MIESVMVNIYYGEDKKLIESFPVSIGKIKSIDEARLLIIKNLDNLYFGNKYKISIFSSFDGTTCINLDFERDERSDLFTTINREFKLRGLLNND